MTLSMRNNFFRGGIIFAALSLGVTVTGGYFALPAFSGAANGAAARPGGIIQFFVQNMAKPQPVVPFLTMLAAAAFSLAGTILILRFFEKTQVPEILFFAFFVMSLSFESARIAIPLKTVFPVPSDYLITSSRILLFGRYFGLFSLFAAGVYAAGFEVQNQQNIFFMLVLAAFVIALNVPIDSLSWDTSLKMLNGYTAMFVVVEVGIFTITVVTFFIAAYTRGSKAYIFAGIGIFLVFTGRNILVCSDTWITPLPGLLFLAAGTWFVCDRLHHEYLWM